MALERSLPLLQQEEEFRAGEGIHSGNTTEKKTLNKTRKQTEGKTRRLLYWSGLLSHSIAKTRINIGRSFERWRELRVLKVFKTDAETAFSMVR